MSTKHPIVWTPQQAMALAGFAHRGQEDKAGYDYFAGHLTSTVDFLLYGSKGGNNERYRALSEEDQQTAEMVAWLHDAPEDTTLSIDTLMRLDAPYAVWFRVDAMTRPRQRSTYRSRLPLPAGITDEGITAGYYAAIKADPILLAVKEADIASNTAPWRMHRLDEETRARLTKKYAKAREALGLEDPWT